MSYQNEAFSNVGEVQAGELIGRFPGTNLKMLYEGGKAYVNEAGTVAQLNLSIRDMVTEEAGEPKGFIGELGRGLAEQLSDPAVALVLKEFLAEQDHYLFYSQTKDGIEVLSIPSVTGNESIDDENIPGMIIVSYSTHGNIPDASDVYTRHIQAIGDRELLSDSETLKKEILEMPTKVNELYKRGLELMKDSPLNQIDIDIN